jgi:hypothetical protein
MNASMNGYCAKDITVSVDPVPPPVCNAEKPETVFSASPKSIILNQSAKLTWNVSSSAPGGTNTKCNISVKSGDTRWSGLSNQGPTGEVSVTPNKSTVYRLVCRNADNSDPSGCFVDSDPREFELKVFAPDVEESPTFRDAFMSLIGKIKSGLEMAFN